jgi:lysophospholipase L1-like esterase
LTGSEFEVELKNIIRWCREHGAQPILVNWPLAAQMIRSGNTPNQIIAAQVASVEQVPMVDLVCEFRKHGGVKLFLDVIHASPAGCDRAAEAMLPTLRRALEKPQQDPVQRPLPAL